MSLILKAPTRKSKAAVESMVYEDMVITSIAEKEKLTVSDDEYQKYVEDNLDTYGMSSVEEFESTYSKDECHGRAAPRKSPEASAGQRQDHRSERGRLLSGI
ncbi:MAG: hypothetical protein ACLR6B_01970 [Blautia sp.]